MKLKSSTNCIIETNKRARARSRFSSNEAQQEWKARVVLARQLRQQKTNRPSWTIKGLVRMYNSKQLIAMLGSVKAPS